MASVNAHRIIFARESRGFSQGDLNDQLGFSPSVLSKLERGELTIQPEVLARIAEHTQYPLSFFYQPGGPASEMIPWRQRDKVPFRKVNAIKGRVNILRHIIRTLTTDLNVKTPMLPIGLVNETHTPAAIARAARKAWELEDGPIANLTYYLEKAGIPIAVFDFDTERIDSRATITEDKKYPLICVNSTHTGDRQRFSIAYQLGHLLMHTFTAFPEGSDIGHEANLFAAEFLVPEHAYRAELEGKTVTLALLKELKLRWRVSMISLLYRADDIGFLTPEQKHDLVDQFNKQKLRRREPEAFDVTPEQPSLIRRWLTTIRRRDKLDTAALAAYLHLPEEDYLTYFG
jgi:Zn-dependent peptidase ImmA (M78 family)